MKSSDAARIWIIGDVHGYVQHVLGQVPAERPDAIIFLGDFELVQPLEVALAPIFDKTEIRFIHGNHETDSPQNYANVFASALRGQNIHGRIEEICGVRIAGLGGVFRKEIWHPALVGEPVHRSYADFMQWLDERRPEQDRSVKRITRSKRELTHLSSIFYDDVAKLSAQQADILVCHEAPSCHPNGFKVIDELARNIGAKIVFHGHHHDCLNYEIDRDRLGFRAYGVGFQGITAHTGEVLVPGAFDKQIRSYTRLSARMVVGADVILPVPLGFVDSAMCLANLRSG